MKFIYFYSPSYEFYNIHLQENLKNIFDLKGIEIEEIEPNKEGHHFDKITLKIELIIEEIKENIGKHIIFSDATIFINSKNKNNLIEYFKNYEKNDLTFINEDNKKYYNIGLILIKCDEKTLNFFEKVLNTMKTNEKYTHDQSAINYLLKDSGLKYDFFDDKIFCGKFKNEYFDSFYIYKSFIDNKNKINNFNQRIQNFYDNKLIDKEIYDKYIINENNENNKNNEKFLNFNLSNLNKELIIFILLLIIFIILLYKLN